MYGERRKTEGFGDVDNICCMKEEKLGKKITLVNLEDVGLNDLSDNGKINVFLEEEPRRIVEFEGNRYDVIMAAGYNREKGKLFLFAVRHDEEIYYGSRIGKEQFAILHGLVVDIRKSVKSNNEDDIFEVDFSDMVVIENFLMEKEGALYFCSFNDDLEKESLVFVDEDELVSESKKLYATYVS